MYYWQGKKNFGDLLGPLLVSHFCHLPVDRSEAADSELVVVGSILEHLPKDWSGIIAGAGLLHEASRPFIRGRVLAVRGPLTSSRIWTSDTRCAYKKYDGVLADPGLLADELVPEQEKLYNLGLVPHWSDKTLETNPLFLKYNPKIIRVSDDPLEVIAQIGQCKKIVASSLHGIILADAFGIPRRIEIPPLSLSNPKQEGGLFKWQDYSASLNMELQIGVTQDADRNIIIEKQHELFDVFEEVRKIFS